MGLLALASKFYSLALAVIKAASSHTFYRLPWYEPYLSKQKSYLPSLNTPSAHLFQLPSLHQVELFHPPTHPPNHTTPSTIRFLLPISPNRKSYPNPADFPLLSSAQLPPFIHPAALSHPIKSHHITDHSNQPTSQAPSEK